MFVAHFISALFLICKNIDWVINSAVALHEDSVTETDQEHVAWVCLEFHSVLVSSCNLDILFCFNYLNHVGTYYCLSTCHISCISCLSYGLLAFFLSGTISGVGF